MQTTDKKHETEPCVAESAKADLGRIVALCQNPHWTPDRKIRISQIATNVFNNLKSIDTEVTALRTRLLALEGQNAGLVKELEIRTRQRDYWQEERNNLRKCFDIANDRLRWCAVNQVQFGLEEGSVGNPDRWTIFQKNRWDLPLGEGSTYEQAIDAARLAKGAHE